MSDRTAAIASSRTWFTKRRGLLVAAAAVVAGTLQQSRAEVAHADPLFGSNSNPNGTGVTGFSTATSGSGHGVSGQTSSSSDDASGIYGTATAAIGRVYGVNGGIDSGVANSSGLKGEASNQSGSTNGVWGTNASTSGNSAGVFGTATATSGSAIGVWGRSSSTGSDAKGVYGEIDAAGGTGTGVYGRSFNGIGVTGLGPNNYGVVGSTLKAGYAGLVGVGTVPGSAGFYALGASGAAAGTFQGNVVINGSLTVTGSYPKSAAVQKNDGTHVRMYCQESPEPWFEDFGTGTLTNGQALVPLDPEFDEVVNGSDYRVFLTEIGDCGGLYVSALAPHRFAVKSRAGHASSGTFHFRVVARRRDDVGKRLEKVEIPTMAPIDVANLTQPRVTSHNER